MGKNMKITININIETHDMLKKHCDLMGYKISNFTEHAIIEKIADERINIAVKKRMNGD